jgi:hypothetical protein
MNNRHIIHPFEIDIFIPELNLGIEYDGLYYHSERVRPNMYYMLKEKVSLIKSANTRVIFINEQDWHDNMDICKSRICSALGKNKKIFARNCVVREISSVDSAKFINDNHMQGNVNASMRFGLFNNDSLVAVMTFAKPRFSTEDIEILRYCSLRNTNIIGGAGKLFAHLRANYKFNSVVSYSDDRWGDGSLYKNLGFEKSESTGLSYFYFGKNKILSRYQCQKSKLPKLLDTFDQTKTEKENMQMNGYYRVWERGNTKWIFHHQGITNK